MTMSLKVQLQQALYIYNCGFVRQRFTHFTITSCTILNHCQHFLLFQLCVSSFAIPPPPSPPFGGRPWCVLDISLFSTLNSREMEVGGAQRDRVESLTHIRSVVSLFPSKAPIVSLSKKL